MYKCEKCNQVYAEQVTTCAICGHDIIEPDVSEPVFIPVTIVPDTTSADSVATVTRGVSKAKGIVGFVMAVESFASSVLIMIYSILISSLIIGYKGDIMSVLDYGYSNPMYATSMDLYTMLFTYLFMAIAEMVLGIIAVSLVNRSRISGYTSKLTSLGKTFGIIGAVISGVTAFILIMAFINL